MKKGISSSNFTGLAINTPQKYMFILWFLEKIKVTDKLFVNPVKYVLSRNWSFYYFFFIKLSFSGTTVIEGGRERKHSWDLSLLFWETRYSN